MAAVLLLVSKEFIDAKIVKVNPDTPQKSVRVAALRSRKILYVPQPRLRTGFFSRIEPGTVPPEKYNFAATARGMKQLAEPMDLDDKTKIDVVVVGSSAVHPETGIRVGKGEGFAELEYGMMRQLGMIDENTPIITTVHDSQVISDDFPPKGKGMMKHDVPVDIIVTPTRTIYVDKTKQPTKPKGIYWDLLSKEKLATIRVLQDLKARIESQTGIELELAEQEE
ncbi:COG0212, partial [Symbiodinium pilosum]